MSRRVLLAGRGEHEVRYLDALRRLFASDPRVVFTLTSKREGRAARPVRDAAGRLGLPYLRRNHARRRWWDLAVFADHGDLFRFPRVVPRLRIQHCMSTGKCVGGESYRYGPSFVLDRRGVAVARNRDVVPRNAYETTVLDDGDVLEVVRMVGGG